MRKYWVLAIGWADGVWPNDELWHIVAEKAGTMMLAGQMVLGTLGPRDIPLGRIGPNGQPEPWLPDWRIGWVKDMDMPPDVESCADLAQTKFTKTLRICTSEAAALEFAEFVLSYGAIFANILTEEEVANLCPLPDDEYIDAMIVDPTDVERINQLNSKIATPERMRYFREHKQIPPL